MKTFFSFLRSLFLSICLILFFVFVNDAIKISPEFEDKLYFPFLILGVSYLVISLLSIIVRRIRRSKMDESDAWMDQIDSFMTDSRMPDFRKFFRILAFWGAVMALVFICVLKVPAENIVGNSPPADFFMHFYFRYLLWSILVIIPLFIIGVLYMLFFLPRYGSGLYNAFSIAGKIIAGYVGAPFQIIGRIFRKDKRFLDIVRFVILLVMVVINTIAVLKTIGIL